MTCRHDESFWRLIGYTAQAMRSYADQQLREYELTVEQLMVLKHVELDTGLPQSRLSTLTSKSPANMTRILDRLEKKQRIVRRVNPTDRRSLLVFLTEEGNLLREEVRRRFERLQDELVTGIPPEHQQVAIGVLRTIRNNIETMSK